MRGRQLKLLTGKLFGRRRGQLEEEGYSQGFQTIAGIDEVGMGPLAGPVVAAAVILPRHTSNRDIRDSKLLKAEKREELAFWIKENAVAWGVGVVDVEEIDHINILRASLLAMASAFKQLNPVPDYLLIDGSHPIPLEFLTREATEKKAMSNRQEVLGEAEILLLDASCPVAALPYQRTLKKGDRVCVSIAAASIVAKVARDRIMMEYDRLYPEYGFGKHKGYSSSSHLTALSRYGPSPIHRCSFRPVRECRL
jgi:ribonuclease HII